MVTVETTATQAPTTRYLATQSEDREFSAVSEARIMPCRYSWPQAKIPRIPRMKPTTLGMWPDAASWVTTAGPSPSRSLWLTPDLLKSWWIAQEKRTEMPTPSTSARAVSHQVDRMVRIRTHS